MGLIVKKDETEHEVIDGVEVIERSDTPDDLPENPVELVDGQSAEDVAQHTEDEADEKGVAEDVANDQDDSDSEADADAREAAAAAVSVAGGVKGATEPKGRKRHKRKKASDATQDAGEKDGGDGNGPSDPKKTERGPLSQLPKHFKIAGIVVLLVVAVVAAVGGYVAGNGGFGAKGVDSATINEDELDNVVATYTYNGVAHNVTVRDAIESQYSLDTAQNDDGTYSVPSSETILQMVRNEILVDEAESRGIDISDDDLSTYAESVLGSSDYDQLASNYGVTADQAKEIVRDNALMQKLYEQVVPEAADVTAPTEPTSPSDNDSSAATEEYAQYIIGLAGDEWDSNAGTWASKDGSYYAALGDDFNGKTATYDQAQTAYYVAYQEYSSKMSEYSNDYRNYANGLFANADIRVYGLYV